jgi:hypothetical protein
MKSKLFVAGCSVSDYTHVNEVYGEILAKNLNYDYIHEAAGCGSNWRIWRRIIGLIMQENLTSNDLLIVQYTSKERKEFWSLSEKQQIYDKINLRETYKNGGNIIRFKLNSHTWQINKKEKNFFKLYEENFINEEFENEVFKTQNLMFQTLLKSYNINVIFFDFNTNYTYIKELNTNIIDVTEIQNNSTFFLENDMFHFNKKGHEYVAKKLYNFISKNNTK